jgi:hypothetical protein
VNGHGGEVAASARLIACAPELLEALREVTRLAESVYSLQGEHGEIAHPVVVQARAAIAKATGEQA